MTMWVNACMHELLDVDAEADIEDCGQLISTGSSTHIDEQVYVGKTVKSVGDNFGFKFRSHKLHLEYH